ncbi:VOC family protein [Pseudarthrobacter sp. NPDC058329]|uniref:VOC family protein n=1 Tax=Pseudarthrobacter sp. NPDC058329 TaxID=3346448 RepID=UPI0036D8D38A
MNTGNLRIETVALRVADLNQALAFWIQGCGLEETTRIPTERFESVILKVPGLEGSAVQLIEDHQENSAVVHGDGLRKLVMSCDNVDERMAVAAAHGGTVVSPPSELPHLKGLLIGSMTCPDGYLVEFLQYQ